VRRPAFERRLAFGKQLGAVVGAGDASPSAENVAHHQFDNVRRHVKFAHAGDEGPPQVMQRPRRNGRVALLARGGSIAASRRSFIRPQPDTGRRAGLIKNEGTVGLRLHARNQLAHQRIERHGVRTAVFRSAARDVPSCAVIAQFAARHAGNFVPPVARQQ
jgi:hypothetical protein